jgi:hypothetical protein
VARISTASFIDVADLVKETEEKYGKVSTIGKQLATTRTTVPGLPSRFLHPSLAYQKSLWDEIGVVPDTWDNLRIGGAKLSERQTRRHLARAQQRPEHDLARPVVELRRLRAG